ncbi:hypothetical protein HK097_004220, partial [Rhizophlyctis rosea]
KRPRESNVSKVESLAALLEETGGEFLEDAGAASQVAQEPSMDMDVDDPLGVEAVETGANSGEQLADSEDPTSQVALESSTEMEVDEPLGVVAEDAGGEEVDQPSALGADEAVGDQSS